MHYFKPIRVQFPPRFTADFTFQNKTRDGMADPYASAPEHAVKPLRAYRVRLESAVLDDERPPGWARSAPAMERADACPPPAWRAGAVPGLLHTPGDRV